MTKYLGGIFTPSSVSSSFMSSSTASWYLLYIFIINKYLLLISSLLHCRNLFNISYLCHVKWNLGIKVTLRTGQESHFSEAGKQGSYRKIGVQMCLNRNLKLRCSVQFCMCTQMHPATLVCPTIPADTYFILEIVMCTSFYYSHLSQPVYLQNIFFLEIPKLYSTVT